MYIYIFFYLYISKYKKKEYGTIVEVIFYCRSKNILIFLKILILFLQK